MLFYTYDSANFKSIEEHHEKNATLKVSAISMIQGCAQ